MAFSVANTVYICAHVASIVIASLYFLYGLAQGEPSLDIAAGKFNILPVRYATLAVISLFQLYLLYAVVRKQTGRSGENSAPAVSKAKPKQKPRKKDGNIISGLYNFELLLSYKFESIPIYLSKSNIIYIFVFVLQAKKQPNPKTTICQKLIKQQRKTYDLAQLKLNN